MKDENYKIYERVILEIKKLTPADGDFIIISFPDDIEPLQVQAFAQGLSPLITDDITILCTRAGVQVEKIPESEMNRLGWYKFDTTKVN